jgi:hypothetical protein
MPLLFLPCAGGVEALLADEARRIAGDAVAVEAGTAASSSRATSRWRCG